ncbi:hypothetical protein IAU60_003794 [Kwoniella sp. DSM 27419]
MPRQRNRFIRFSRDSDTDDGPDRVESFIEHDSMAENDDEDFPDPRQGRAEASEAGTKRRSYLLRSKKGVKRCKVESTSQGRGSAGRSTQSESEDSPSKRPVAGSYEERPVVDARQQTPAEDSQPPQQE